jgi:hypothetical protein
MTARFRILLAVTLALSVSVAFGATFKGSFKANGADAKLAYLMTKKGTPFSGKPVTLLIFTEKDASKDPDPESNAQFGRLGDALVVHLEQDGDKWDVIGTEFMHASLKHSGASGAGIVAAENVKAAGGELSGHLFTKPGEDLFGEPIAVDLHFHAKQP